MFAWEIRSWYAANTLEGPVLFDRGIPDVVGYLNLIGMPVPSHIEQAARTLRYHPRVFIAPHWPAIYARDAERKQSSDEAEATFRAVASAYSRFGYDLQPLPLAPVEERVRFVVDLLTR
jgi:predicted ATPase